MAPTRPRLLLLAALLALGACGRTDGHPVEPRPPSESWAALEQAAQAGDTQQVRLLLESWPVGEALYIQHEATQQVITWRLGLRVESGDIEGALIDHGQLVAQFSGEGRSRSGRVLPAQAVRLATLDSLVVRARTWAQGSTPDSARAKASLAAARSLLEEGDEEEARLGALSQWIGATHQADVAQALGLGAVQWPSPAVLVFSDHFTLGEPVFSGVLERWARQGKEAGLRVLLLGARTGQTRVGLRRVPAASRQAEEEALRSRAAELGLEVGGFVDASEIETMLGLESQEVALLMTEGSGRLVGRLAGRNLDPRDLEGCFQRAVSR